MPLTLTLLYALLAALFYAHAIWAAPWEDDAPPHADHITTRRRPA